MSCFLYQYVDSTNHDSQDRTRLVTSPILPRAYETTRYVLLSVVMDEFARYRTSYDVHCNSHRLEIGTGGFFKHSDIPPLTTNPNAHTSYQITILLNLLLTITYNKLYKEHNYFSRKYYYVQSIQSFQAKEKVQRFVWEETSRITKSRKRPIHRKQHNEPTNARMI